MKDIREDDILWKFYCKRFTLDNREIEPPKSLCPYVHKAAYGFCLWLSREVKLKTFWLAALVSALLLAAGMQFIPKNQPANFLVVVAVVAFVIFCEAVLMFALWITGLRALRLLEPLHWFKITLSLGAACFVIPALLSQTPNPEFWRIVVKDLRIMGYLALTVLAATAFIVIIMVVLESTIISHPSGEQKFKRLLEKLARFFRSIGQYMAAKKKGVCPPVNPPKEFRRR